MRLSSIRLVVELRANPQLPKALEAVITQLVSTVGGKLNPTGVPDDTPPEIPRVVISSPNLQIQIGLSRAEALLTPPSHVAPNLMGTYAYIRQMVEGPLSALFDKLYPYKWAGIVAEVDQPVSNAQSMIDAVRDKVPLLTKVNYHISDLAAFSLRYGFREDEYFKHIVIQGYETRVITKHLEAGKSVHIDLSGGALHEAGLQLILDINNKPKQVRHSTLEDISLLLDKLLPFIHEAPSILGLEAHFNKSP